MKCLLCGGPPAFRGFWEPDDQAAFGAPPGKTRMVMYALCARCGRDPDRAAEEVEKVFFRRLAAGAN
jgi:hypothetical protein